MQFNWLFVMIIGGIILVTFLGFAMKQRDVSEDLTKSSIASSLDAIISSAQSSSGEVSVIKVPDEEMTFECNRIAVGNAAKQYENLILFSPKTIKSDSIITQTMSLNIPFKTANLLFVTSPDVRYILVGDFRKDFTKWVKESMPKEAVVDAFYSNGISPPPLAVEKPFNEIENEKHSKVRFVVVAETDPFSAVPSPFQDMEDKDVTKLVISGNGDVNFYRKSGTGWAAASIDLNPTHQYINETVIGAIYSDDKEQYKCSMGNVKKRVQKVTDVYKKRVVGFATGTCGSAYTGVDTSLNTISSFALETQPNIAAMITAIRSIIAKNKELQISSCPLIY